MIITQTPVRLSFFGGNTDFREYFLKYGGLCLTATIDKYIYCIVKKRFDDLIIVNYSDKETVKNVDDLKHNIARETLKMSGIEKGIEISFLADIPSSGTGLGSSSAVTVGLLNALHAYRGDNVGSAKLAEEAALIEIDVLKNHIGEQDQHAVAFGGLRAIKFKKSGKVFAEIVGISKSIREDFNNSLMLFYTGATRKTSEVLASLDIANSTKSLDLKKVFANEGTINLVKGNLKKFGELLGGSWAEKRKANVKTTSSEIDLMYEKAINAGAIGGKVMGAGGGGFLLVMFPANKRAKIRESLREYKEMSFRFNDFGSRVIFNI